MFFLSRAETPNPISGAERILVSSILGTSSTGPALLSQGKGQRALSSNSVHIRAPHCHSAFPAFTCLSSCIILSPDELHIRVRIQSLFRTVLGALFAAVCSDISNHFTMSNTEYKDIILEIRGKIGIIKVLFLSRLATSY